MREKEKKRKEFERSIEKRKKQQVAHSEYKVPSCRPAAARQFVVYTYVRLNFHDA